MTPDALFLEFEKGFPARKFSAGLLVAFIDLLLALDTPKLKLSTFDALLEKFPRQLQTSAGKRANTLIVSIGGSKTLSLRPYYNAVEQFFRADHKRFDYPSCAPHATQAWNDYQTWLNALVTYSENELKSLRGRVTQFVLDTLASQAFDPASVNAELVAGLRTTRFQDTRPETTLSHKRKRRPG